MHQQALHTSLLRAAKTAPMLGVDQERALAAEARSGSPAAIQALVTSHLRLVVSIAQSYAKHGVAIEELVSEGLLGLMEACRRFESERGARFAVYAAWWIRAYIRRYTLANRRIVRTPSTRNARKLLAQMRKTQRDIAQHTGAPADASRVASALGVRVEDVETMEGALGGRDVLVGTSHEGVHFEPRDAGPSPEHAMADRQVGHLETRALRSALASLDARERTIVQQRYFEDEPVSLAQIARRLGLSRERVRQLEHRAHRKLRDAIGQRVA